jgi:hypothetical protein
LTLQSNEGYDVKEEEPKGEVSKLLVIMGEDENAAFTP